MTSSMLSRHTIPTQRGLIAQGGVNPLENSVLILGFGAKILGTPSLPRSLMHVFIRILMLAAFLMPLTVPAQMLQDQTPPQHRIVHKSTFALRYNPVGLLFDGRFSYRYRLYESDSKALRDNFLGLGLAPTVSPAFLRLGPYVEFNPLTLFGVWATMQYVQYFGSFDLLQGFPGAQSDFSDSAIKRNAANRFSAHGWELTLGATFQAKVSSLLIRSQAKLVRGDLNLHPGDRIYYDQLYDVGAPNRGWFLTNDLDVLYQGPGNKLIAGVRYTATAPFYNGSRHFDPDDLNMEVDNASHRVGPFVGYTFKAKDGARFNTPTIFFLAQWWLHHRFRTGEDTSAALPLVGIGFQTTGDFLPVK
ncbi:hypothetical protein POL68_13345 [Stigmatella sp. ncwal1]|uniref:Alginate export domain-containing protein n=1 Tax=Stigmatella ashevillensis TaxID=2995309 RepID=A0ABT5D719_9BACT|nr:hypothetical protein [Stigmatella ashevillena]MDC0709450.1 hypothetical protein [Stigmatella ashevillena]